MRWCGPEVEVEGIVSLKTGGCPEDCHFCSQSGLFESPVRAAWLDIPIARRGGQADRGDRRHGVLHRRRRARPGREADGAGRRGRRGDQGRGRHQRRLLAGHAHAASRSTSSPRWACTATTTTSRPRARTSRTSSRRTPGRSGSRRCGSSARRAWRCAAAGSSGWGRRVEQRAELAAQLAALEPDEVPLNFLNPRPGTPFGRPRAAGRRRRAAHDRGVPAGDAAHGAAVRGRPGDHPGRPRRAAGPARRDQRRDRRQLPHHARAGPPRPTSTCWASCRCRSRP